MTDHEITVTTGSCGRMLTRVDETVFNRGSCATARSYYYTNEGDAVILRPDPRRATPVAVERFPIDDHEFERGSG